MSTGLASSFLAKSLLVQLATPAEPPQPASLLRHLLDAAVQSDARAASDEYRFDPDAYAYLIVHYHKTGNHLSRQLRDFLVLAGESATGAGKGGGGGGGTLRSSGPHNLFHFRSHDEETGCPRAMRLSPGVAAVQGAPDFFCDANVFAEYLLRNDDALRDKRGVKVVHLVRDPFDLAISNWIYHAQYPTPESWVKTADPCTEELWDERWSLGDLVEPTLMAGDDPVMTREDVEALHGVCEGIYKHSGEDSKQWSYYTHLRHLDPRKALALATTHMMIQGISGGDILRMANNLVKLKQVQQLEDHIRTSQHMMAPEPHERMIQVISFSMAEFTREPYASTLRFLDFALENAVSPEVKERIAGEYERAYNEKLKGGNEHITADKEILNGMGQNIVDQKASLTGFLRRHPLFGRVLGNVERLVNDALRDSGSTIV